MRTRQHALNPLFSCLRTLCLASASFSPALCFFQFFQPLHSVCFLILSLNSLLPPPSQSPSFSPLTFPYPLQPSFEWLESPSSPSVPSVRFSPLQSLQPCRSFQPQSLQSFSIPFNPSPFQAPSVSSVLFSPLQSPQSPSVPFSPLQSPSVCFSPFPFGPLQSSSVPFQCLQSPVPLSPFSPIQAPSVPSVPFSPLQCPFSAFSRLPVFLRVPSSPHSIRSNSLPFSPSVRSVPSVPVSPPSLSLQSFQAFWVPFSPLQPPSLQSCSRLKPFQSLSVPFSHSPRAPSVPSVPFRPLPAPSVLFQSPSVPSCLQASSVRFSPLQSPSVPFSPLQLFIFVPFAVCFKPLQDLSVFFGPFCNPQCFFCGHPFPEKTAEFPGILALVLPVPFNPFPSFAGVYFPFDSAIPGPCFCAPGKPHSGSPQGKQLYNSMKINTLENT